MLRLLDVRDFLPSAPWFALVALAAAWAAGHLRMRVGLQTAYTRKIFHFVIFTLAAVIHVRHGAPGVVAFGSFVAAMVLVAVWRGDGFPFYEAMARPRDAPRRGLFIVVPLLTTAIGGLVATLLFDRFAFVGFLVAGWGDAIAEPVGAAWGRHPYRVPSIAGIAASRTLEGSVAVLAAGSFAATIGLWTSGAGAVESIGVGALCGLLGAWLEAVSPHGLDNFTVQVGPAFVAWWMLG